MTFHALCESEWLSWREIGAMKGILLKTEGFGAGSYGAFAPADTHSFIKASGVLSRQLHHQMKLGVCVFAG